MNRDYVIHLMDCKRIGKLIKLLNDNIFNWSDDDFKYILNKTLETNTFRIFHYIKVICPYYKWKLLDKEINYAHNEKQLILICINGNINMLNYIILKSKTIHTRILFMICVYGLLESLKIILIENIKIVHYMFLQEAYYSNTTCIIDYILLHSVINKANCINYGIDNIKLKRSTIEYLLSTQVHDLYPNIYSIIINNYNETYYSVDRSICYDNRVKILLKLSEKYPILHPKYALIKFGHKIEDTAGHKIDGLYELS